MWSRKYDKCVVCGTTDKKHRGKGMCTLCYYKKWRKENPDKAKEYNRVFYKNNLEKVKEYSRMFYKNNSEKVKEFNKKWRKENSEKVKKIVRRNNKEWRKRNPEKFKKQRSNYWMKRSKADIHFKLRNRISSAVRKKLNCHLSSKNGKSTFSFLPYSVDELKVHLESLFKPGMSWTNYGNWHIDHIKPDCKFNYKSVEDEEFQKCWALDNLQPLWAEENIRKNKY